MLHKTVEQLAWAEAEATRRAPLLAAIAQLETARQEVAWLFAYEANADRYKVLPHVLLYASMRSLLHDCFARQYLSRQTESLMPKQFSLPL